MRLRVLGAVVLTAALALGSGSARAITTFDDNVTPDAIFGSGNSNGLFTVDRSAGVELGLRAKIPFSGVVHSNGDGTYSYTLAELLAGHPSQRWNFDWTVNTDWDTTSGFLIDDLTYLLELDFDPSAGTDFLAFDPITPLAGSNPTPLDTVDCWDHSIGTNATGNGGGAEASCPDAVGYAGLIAANNVAQQSWRHAFFPFHPSRTYDPTVNGIYDVVLTAFSGVTPVASTSIQVIVSVGPCGDRYVDTGGSDGGNDCLLVGSPCATIQHAIDQACPAGDTINVGAGTFSEPSIHVTKSVTIVGDDPSTTFIETSAGAVGMYIDADDATVRDLTIQPGAGPGTQGVRFEKAGGAIDNTEFNNVHIVDHSSNAIELHNDTTVTDLRIVDCTLANNSAAIRSATSSTVDGLLLTDSTIDGNLYGIYKASDGSVGSLNDLQVRDCTFLGTSSTSIYVEEITNSVIEDNEFTANERGLTLFKYLAGTPDIENLVIRNNTFTDTGDFSVLAWVFGSGLAGTGILVEGNTIAQDASLMDQRYATIDVALDPGFSNAPFVIRGNAISFSGTLPALCGANPCASYGIEAQGALDSVTVTLNQIDGGGVADVGGLPPNSGVYINSDDSLSGQGPATGTIDINCNRIAGFVNGLSVYDSAGGSSGGLPVGAGVSANDNSISGNSGFGIDNSGTSETVDANDNWWGCVAGPGNPGCDTVTANVDVTTVATSVPACVSCTADAQCDDGLTCTGTETCNLGTNMCEAGTPVVCSDQCETGVCLEPAGTCELQPDGFVCSATPDACTLDDTCQTGVCTDGGGGDGDADGVCNADDNCPVDANPGQYDIDDDTIGDVCDLDDGPSMNVTRAILKRQRKPTTANGSVLVKGDFIADPESVLTSSTTITVKVVEDFGFVRLKTWNVGAECTINAAGRVTCKSLDRTLKAAFKPFRKAPGVFRFKMNFKKQAIPADTLFSAPVVVTVSFGPHPPAIGAIDRVGDIADCQATSRGIKCRE